MKKILCFLIALIALFVFIGCNKNDDIAPTKLVIEGAKSEMTVGDEVAISVKFTPADVTLKDVEWQSTNPSVLKITVGSRVVVKALQAGESSIVVSSKSADVKATFNVKVVEEEVILPTALEFNNAPQEIALGSSKTLSTTITPLNVSDKTIVWSSSDEETISVVDGVITAKKTGSATITAKCAADESVTAMVTITVVEITLPDVVATDINIMTTATLFVVNNTFKLSVYPIPTDAELKCEWTSSNEEVATVDDNGRVTCVAVGSAVITCHDIYSDITKTYEIDVIDTPALTGMTLNDRNIKVGETAILKVTPEPEFAIAKVTWSTSDESIATVDEEGKVVGKAVGEATITATDESGLKATCTIKVESDVTTPQSIVLTTTFAEVTVGYPVKFVAEVQPSGVDQRVIWTSNNEKVGTIDAQGLFTPIAEGTTRIRATSVADEEVKSSFFTVKVVMPVEKVIPDLQGYEIIVMNAASALHEHDPFLDGYSGLDKSYKQEVWRKIETDYNCKIIVKAYPDDAPWGPVRIKWIKDNAFNRTSQCDFGVLAAQWLPQFVNSTDSALIDTTDFFMKFGNNQIEPALKDAGSYMGKFYAVSSGLTIRTYPIQGLFYNYGLLQKLGLKSPAEMFNEGTWTYSKFEEFCLTAQAKMAEGQYVIAGCAPLCWQGMVNAAGVKLADTTTLQLNIKHRYSYEAIAIMENLYKNGCWDPANTTSEDASVTTFQSGDALFQPAQYWFVRSPNRFPESLWGENNTFYGYVPYPYPDDIAKENTRTNFVGESMWMMIAGREYPAGVTAENIYQAVQDMFLSTIDAMNADPLISASAVLRSATEKRIDDPASVDATLFFTADKTMFDPYFDDSFQYSYGGETARAVVASIQGNDPAEEFEAIYNTVDVKFKAIFAN